MKVFKAILGVGALVLLFILLGISMFLFDLCPPDGPWPIPPWCSSVGEAVYFETDYKAGSLTQVIGVNMADTWGANYNFGMFENTRDNIDSSFDRISSYGSKEVFVHDFHRAVYSDSYDSQSLDYEIVDEIFMNDQRDESMTQEDMNNLAKSAHLRGMKIGINQNMAFVDIGKYIGLGDISSAVEKDISEFNDYHSEEWVRDFFSKWKMRMVERAKMAEKANVDYFSITPSWMEPTYHSHEELVNDLWKEVIFEVSQVYSGEISIRVSSYGFIEGFDGKEDWTKYDYYKDADMIEYRFYSMPEGYKVGSDLSKDNIKLKFEEFFSDLNSVAVERDVKMSIMFAPFSYPSAIDNGIVEYHDILDKENLISRDWKHQEDSYQAFFESLEGKGSIEKVLVGGYWWDDAMDPEVFVKISVSPSIRNKPAEAVVKKWASS